MHIFHKISVSMTDLYTQRVPSPSIVIRHLWDTGTATGPCHLGGQTPAEKNYKQLCRYDICNI